MSNEELEGHNVDSRPGQPSPEADAPTNSSATEQLGAAEDFGENDEPCASEEGRKLALAVAAAGLERKAAGIEIIDVTGKVDYTELIVLMSGRSDRHVHAIAKGLQKDLKAEGVAPLSVEGAERANWVLLDYNDVVVHVFQEDARCFYDLEGLWIDAGRVAVPEPPRSGSESRPSPAHA